MRLRPIIFMTLAVVAVGLFLGPGYLTYCWFFSGSAAGEYPISVGKPVELELSPKMNPVRFNSVVQYDRPHIVVGREETNFRATLKREAHELWAATFGVRESSDRDERRHRGTGLRVGETTVTNYSSIRTFSVETPGRYEFVVTRGRQSDLHVNSITLKVRKNVAAVNVPLTAAGWVMLVGAVLAAMIKGFMGSEAGKRRKQK